MIGPTLKGKKIILKPQKVSEASNYLRWLKNPKINKFLITDGKGLTLKKEEEYLRNLKKDKTMMNWGIYINKKHIGATGLKKIDQKKNKKAIWGIFIGEKDEWGKGYGTDVLKTLLKFSFNKLKLNRVELSVYKENIGGKKCYTRCGFKKEGIKRKSVMIEGKFMDEIIMGILKSEYKNI